MEIVENYVYKKEVDWSLFNWGLTLPIENQVVFGRNMDRFLKRGESKSIKLYLDGKPYDAKIVNVNFDPKFKRKNDTLQIRYNKDFANVLQSYFFKSYQYIVNQKNIKIKNGDRTMIKLPEEFKDYLVIYTTEYDDSYVLETILAEDITAFKYTIEGQQERIAEASFNCDIKDCSASFIETEKISKIRKLNRKIGDNLKLLYDYRCQICGKVVGEEYGSHVAEAHHIDYFINSLNNDSSNQMIVCPNHHSIIHDVNPVFDRNKKMYLYPNGRKEGLILNLHL